MDVLVVEYAGCRGELAEAHPKKFVHILDDLLDEAHFDHFPKVLALRFVEDPFNAQAIVDLAKYPLVPLDGLLKVAVADGTFTWLLCFTRRCRILLLLHSSFPRALILLASGSRRRSIGSPSLERADNFSFPVLVHFSAFQEFGVASAVSTHLVFHLPLLLHFLLFLKNGLLDLV